MSRQTTIVPRVSNDETTFAVIQWEGVPRDELVPRLRQALTSWVDETDEGRGWWQDTAETFNVGDLANVCPRSIDVPEDELAARLRAAGFTYLDVECYSDVSPAVLEFDDVLVECGRVQAG